MPLDEDCIFCRIAEGRTETALLYEDDTVVAFEDLHPLAPVHQLVIPRRHIATLDDADEPSLLGHLIEVARELARRAEVHESGYRTLFNCQRDAGQVVFHLHLHLIGGRRLGPMC